MKAEEGALLEKARESLEAARLLNGAGYANIAASRGYCATSMVGLREAKQQGLRMCAVLATIQQGREWLRRWTLGRNPL